ncbi:tripartite tricarboxylate transporter permease [Paracoccus litorisediminis]|uniref:tripartite tricarboxylate transporter permease n=1 Tax=Paracoccus litorisediminis TaxID=2006130 RepID=UPI003733E674
MISLFFENVGQLMSPTTLAFMLGGLLFGLFFGALPGLSAAMAVAILLPLTFSLPPDVGMAMLVAAYVGGISGGLVSATLLRIPGTPSSIATTFDAYPLARSGKPVKALATGIVASAVGSLLSLVVLVLCAPLISQLAIRIGAQEYTTLTLAALMLVVILSKANLAKGLMAAAFGMSLAMIGFAPIGATPRFSFGVVDIMAGISIIPFMVGLFAVSTLISSLREPSLKMPADMKLGGRGIDITVKEFVANGWNMLRSAAIGVGIGVLPGIGGTASNLIAYAAAHQQSKTPEKFGKGTVEGIYASETANNASVGGALLPLLTLGIPGDGVTAILIGGFTIHGLQPGPLLFSKEPDLIAMIYAAFLIGTLMLLAIQLFTIRLFPRVLGVPRQYLLPILTVLMVTGTFVSDNRLFDVWLMLGFGVLGYIFEKYGYPLGPMVLGFVLAPILETNFRRALSYSEGDWTTFVTRPVSGMFLFVASLLLLAGLRAYLRNAPAKPSPAV